MLIRGRLSTKAIPVLICIGLFPAACAVTSDHSPPAYEYNDPIYSSVNLTLAAGAAGVAGAAGEVTVSQATPIL